MFSRLRMSRCQTLSTERRAWLRSVGITPRLVRLYGLDRPMHLLAWMAMVREVIRQHGTQVESHSELRKRS
jgi:hypothetical protein